MPVTTIGWQSPARRQAILERFAVRADAALLQWAAPGAIASSFEHAKAVASVADCWMFDARRGAIVVLGPEHAFADLACRLLGLEAADGLGMADGLGRRAFADLLASMCGVAASECAIERPHAPSPEQMDPRRGVASFRWRIADLDLVLHCDAALCAHLLPRVREPATGLAAREAAVMASVVDVEAVVGLGRIDALRIADLKPGQVIRTGVRLDAPLELRFGSERSALTGQLVAAGERRAFRRGNTTSQGELPCN